MKQKILLFSIATLLFSWLNPMVAKASTQFYEGEYISNMWVNKEKNGKIRYQQARLLRRTNDNQFAYCIEPWSEISSNTIYTDIIDINSLSDETLERLSLIAYYGYGYQNHTDIKWYYITQVLIWKEVDPSSSFYFTNSLNGSKITTYDDNMREILNLVQKHQKKPNFSIPEVELLLGEKGTIIDVNSVLEEYNVISSPDNVTIDKKANRINMDTLKLGTSSLTLERKDTMYQTAPIVYRHPVNQNFLTVGSYKPITYTILVNVVGGIIEIEKIDKTTSSTTPQGDASLLGSVFEVYNSKNELVKEITLEEGNNKITDLVKGTYTIKEKKPGTGYLLNTEEKTVTIDAFHKKVNVSFENQVITNEIIIEKFYGKDNGPWYQEVGITFGIYNQNNDLVEEVTTNSNGQIQTFLPYGTYTVKQINGPENYEKVEDFIITVEIEGKIKTFKKYNKEKAGKVLIIKLDKDDSSIIESNPATFTIYEKNTNKEIGTYQTNEEGLLIINDLSYGTYLLKETIPPTGYLNQDEITEFIIDNDNREIVLEIYNQREEVPKEDEIIHTINVPNTSTWNINLGKEISDDPKKYRNYYIYNLCPIHEC